MLKISFNIAMAAVAVLCLMACHDKKPAAPVKRTTKVEAPKGPMHMGDNITKRSTNWLGANYTVGVTRKADGSLPLASDGTHDYYDNAITVSVNRPDGTQFFSRRFTKADFKAYVDDYYYKKGALLGIVFVGAQGNTLNFAASVGNPDESSDEYVPLILKISNLGAVSIAKDEDLE